MARTKISKAVLIELYVEGKLTQLEVAERLNCTQSTISRCLKLYGLESRGGFGGDKPVPQMEYEIDIEVLKKLYFEDKLTQEEIAERLGCTTAAIQRRMYKHNIQSRSGSQANLLRYKSYRADFDGSDYLKAYMLGFCKGDVYAWVRDKGSETIRLMTNTTKSEQKDLFVSLFESYGHLIINDKKPVIHMAAFVNMTFDFLLDDKDHVPDWVLNDEEVFFAFLAGYSDAEANIGVYNGYAVFKLDSCDKNVIFACYQMLSKTGLEFPPPSICAVKGQIDKHGYSYNNDMWRLCSRKKETLLNLFERLNPYLRHAKRRQDLSNAIANINERNSRQKGKQ
jgi:predicted transcriptional regulator